MTKKKTLLIVIGVLMLALGAVSAVAGGVILSMNGSLNDAEGYALSNTCHVQTSANAFSLWVGAPRSDSELKWVVSTDSNKEVFAGWGPASIMNSYAENYTYATAISGWSYHARAYSALLNITNVQIVNPQKPDVPLSEEAWLDTVKTSSVATLYCSPNGADRSGVLIVMNADGSKGVDAEIQLGSRIALFGWLPYVLLPVGMVLLIVGFMLIIKSRKIAKTTT